MDRRPRTRRARQEEEEARRGQLHQELQRAVDIRRAEEELREEVARNDRAGGSESSSSSSSSSSNSSSSPSSSSSESQAPSDEQRRETFEQGLVRERRQRERELQAIPVLQRFGLRAAYLSRRAIKKMTDKVTVAGSTTEWEILQTAIEEDEIQPEAVFSKEKRKDLKKNRPDKWQYQRERMEEGLEVKYTEVSVNETNLSVLSNTYELVQQNKRVKERLIKWDMLDVFSLVKYDEAKKEIQQTDLMTDWPKVTVQDVVESNKFYMLRMDATKQPWLRENLEISDQFILNSCDQQMKAQLTDKLDRYKPAERGGPLTFKLLMDLVQVNSERAIEHLIKSVKKLDLKDFDGENVYEVVAQIRGAKQRLNMVDFSGTGKSVIPVDWYRDIMDVLQTSSTESFNKCFDYRTHEAMTHLQSSNTYIKDVDKILMAAEHQYSSCLLDGSWAGKDHKANEMAFPAQIKVGQGAKNPAGPCFNCGSEDHLMKNCPKPENKEHQEMMRKQVHPLWNKNRKKKAGRGGGGRGGGRGGRGRGRGRGEPRSRRSVATTGPFRPPEASENNRRTIMIRGVATQHSWDPARNWWDPVATVAEVPTTGTILQAQVVPTAIPPSGASSVASEGSTSSAAQTRAQIANMQQSLQTTFANLLASIPEN